MRHALMDVDARTRGAILVYPALWLAIVLTSGMQREQLGFALVNAGIFAAVSLLRLVLHVRLPRIGAEAVHLWRAWFVAGVLCNGLHIGVLTALTWHLEWFTPLQLPMLLTLAAVAAAGTTLMGIHRGLGMLFPVVTLTPVGLAAVYAGTSADLVLAGGGAVLLFHLLRVAKQVREAYWSGLTDAERLAARTEELQQLSRTDPLTGLFNRVEFNARLAAEWRIAHRQRAHLAVLMVDLDHFKQVNDTHGHPFGDTCLRAAACVLTRVITQPDAVIARYGGEEFVVLLPAASREAAGLAAAKVVNAMAASPVPNGEREVALTCSVGVAACVPAAPGDGWRLIDAADSALYQAKAAGRNRFMTAPLAAVSTEAR